MKGTGEQRGSPGEDELIRRLQQKDPAAVGALYDRYAGALYGIITRMVQSEAVAEDVLQETFIKIWRSFASYDASKGRLVTWLFSVARSVALDKVRSKGYRNTQKNQSLADVVDTVDQQRNVSFNIDSIGIDSLIAQLRPEQRQVLDLIYFRGFTHEEASEDLGIPLGTVKTRLRAALIVLRKEFVNKERLPG